MYIDHNYRPISHNSIKLQNYDYGRKIFWNFNKRPGSYCHLWAPDPDSLAWVSRRDFPTRKRLQVVLIPVSESSAQNSHGVWMKWKAWYTSIWYLPLPTRNASRFQIVQICSNALENGSKSAGTFGGGWPVVTCRHMSCHHVQDPKLVGVECDSSALAGDTNSTGPGGKVRPWFRIFGSAQIAMCFMIRASCESWTGTITRRPVLTC